VGKGAGGNRLAGRQAGRKERDGPQVESSSEGQEGRW